MLRIRTKQPTDESGRSITVSCYVSSLNEIMLDNCFKPRCFLRIEGKELKVIDAGVGSFPPKVVNSSSDPILDVLLGLAVNWVRHSVLVNVEGKLEGMVSARDLLSFLGGGGFYSIVEDRYEGDLFRALKYTEAKELSYTPPRVYAQEEFAHIVSVMLEKRVGAVAVLNEENVPVGLVSERHIINLFTCDYIGVKVSEIMSYPLAAVPPETPVIDALRLLVSRHIRRLPIIENKEIKGMVTIKDLIAFFSKPSTLNQLKNNKRDLVWAQPLNMLASKKVVTIDAERDVGEALQKMKRHGIGSLIVMVDDEPKAIVTERDIVTKLPKITGVEVFIDELEKTITAARIIR